MITIGRYRFEGPVYNRESLNNAPGVYVVLDDRGTGSYSVLDIGESEQIKTRLQSHDREGCWLRNCQGRVCYTALHMPGSTHEQRWIIEKQLREQYSATCGVR